MGKIIWLASYPKSGNTWLRAFLHNYITHADSPYSINALADLTAIECASVWFRKYHPAPETLTPPETQRLRPAVHRDLISDHSGPVFVKTHNANLALHNIAFCTPALTAGAICVIRDPRDIAVSYAAYIGKPIDDTIDFMNQKGAANRATSQQVFELLTTWSAHVTSWTQNKAHLVLRYEDLVATPHTTFARVETYVGATPSPENLSRAIEFSRFETLAAQERRHGYDAHAPTAATPFFRTGQPGNWRTILTPAQATRIETDHESVMRRWGYL